MLHQISLYLFSRLDMMDSPEDILVPNQMTQKLLNNVKFKVVKLIWDNYENVLDRYLDRDEQARLMKLLLK